MRQGVAFASCGPQQSVTKIKAQQAVLSSGAEVVVNKETFQMIPAKMESVSVASLTFDLHSHQNRNSI